VHGAGVGALQAIGPNAIGCAIGAWFAGPISAKLGRITVMKIAALIFFVTSLACGFAWDIGSLTVFRLIGGFAVGAASVIAPAYIAEVSPSAIRGRLGSLQQLAIVVGGVALLDCRSLEAESLELDECVSLLVIDSGVTRRLEGSPWEARREESFGQAASLGVEHLRDLPSGAPLGNLPLARHVVEEIGRVQEFAGALRRGDLERAGSLMTASHESSRDLWRSSLPQLDLLVDELVAAGAYGARLTGGGFGGATINLVNYHEVEGFIAHMTAGYEKQLGVKTKPLVCQVVDGAN